MALLSVLLLYLAQEQPLPYSHKTHVALGLKCAGCHVNPEPGEHMTFPATAKCMRCHASVARDKESIRKLADFAAAKQAIPWVRVYAVSSGIFWNHRTHLLAGAKCEVCHGDVARMERITKAKDVVSMGGCIACHKQYKAPLGCESCHEGK